jgi:multiple sugar transport system permease protein
MATATDNRAVPSAVAASNEQKPGRRGESFTGWAFVAPFALFGLFLVVPAVYGLYLSFTGETLTGSNG